MSAGMLTPPFSPSQTEYEVQVPYATQSAAVTSLLWDSLATLTVNDQAVANGSAPSMPLSYERPNLFQINVKSKDASATKTYNVTINRQRPSDVATLRDLTIDGSTVPDFAPETYAYTVDVPNATTSVTTTGAPAGDGATVAVSGGASLSVGDNLVHVTVTAQDGVSTQTYTVHVVRAPSSEASLSDLTIDGATVPDFAAGTFDYTINVPNATTSVTTVGTPTGDGATVVVSGGARLAVGDNLVHVTVTAQDGITTQTYTVHVVRAAPNVPDIPNAPDVPSAPGVPGPSPQPSPSPAPPATLLKIGNALHADAISAAWSGAPGAKDLLVSVNGDKLAALLTTTGEVLSIEVAEPVDGVRVMLDRKGLTALLKYEDQLIVRSPLGEVRFPVNRLQWDEQAQNASVQMAKAERLADTTGLQVWTAPTVFKIMQTVQNRETEVPYPAYIEHLLPLPGNVLPGTSLTAAAVQADGAYRPKPTKIVAEGDRRYALINSRSGGAFALVSASKSFQDTSGHWAEKEIGEMATRLIMNGYEDGRFSPGASVTRAEFVSILLRGLGLDETTSSPSFTDVASSKWYDEVVRTAVERGIASGYEDHTFRPAQQVTREEAFVMLANALRLANPSAPTPAADDLSLLADYRDQQELSAWARSSAAAVVASQLVKGIDGSLAPAQSMTRAELAIIVDRLLKQSGLIQ
ncbi:cadherin-like beta sandwich domain-containing protein [Cohnella sp. REN36]|uniref:cadherin-like beta sandwich domain-containing protein n=1 Tax=Cohnella sp. REN36 TaxID=2887347 RepID=UPI001D148959|nr:cadherin-like beta sandwich domain-containing protein [Cohnella sp. REN36]